MGVNFDAFLFLLFESKLLEKVFLVIFLFFLFNSIPKQTNFINTLPKGFFSLEFEAFKGNILSNWNSYLFFVTNRFNFVSTFFGVFFVHIHCSFVSVYSCCCDLHDLIIFL